MWSQDGMKRCYLGKGVDKRLYFDALKKKNEAEKKLTLYEERYGKIEEGL